MSESTTSRTGNPINGDNHPLASAYEKGTISVIVGTQPNSALNGRGWNHVIVFPGSGFTLMQTFEKERKVSEEM